MATKDDDPNAYELLDLTLEATEAEIRTAYRQRSLKVHPDRHPNNPDAAHKFHELNQAYELLLDPIAKTKLDAKLRVKLARQERFAKGDAKLKRMKDELDQAERAVKKTKTDIEMEQRVREQDAERIKEEGRRMRQERENELNRKEEQKLRDIEAAETFKLGEFPVLFVRYAYRTTSEPLDTTVRVKYPLSKHPTLTTPLSLASVFSSFGNVDMSSIVISTRPSKKAPHKPPKFATALIPFEKIGQAHAAVCASGVGARGLKDIEVSWAEGKEPKALDALKRTYQMDPGGGNQESTSVLSQPITSHIPTAASGTAAFSTLSAPSFSFDPSEARPNAAASSAPGLDFESITLMRLRQAERQRLEREIREQEAVN
ncbi:DnaJ-domain-containing protein [Gautieria morchelliformis]|nr:DnaJ-domain-containing protein [Gautieria morchelliformis]